MKQFLGLLLLCAGLSAPAEACDVVVGQSAVQVFAAPLSVATVAVPTVSLAVETAAVAVSVPQAFVTQFATPVVVQQACFRPVARLFGARARSRTVVRQRVVVR